MTMAFTLLGLLGATTATHGPTTARPGALAFLPGVRSLFPERRRG